MPVLGVPETDRGFDGNGDSSYYTVKGCFDRLSVGCGTVATPGQQHLEVVGEGGFDLGPPDWNMATPVRFRHLLRFFYSDA